jgi:hypothetical protein
MALNIVSNTLVVNEFKKSRFFRKNLGLVTTVDKNGSRVYNDKDRFGLFYNTQYKTTIFAQGNIGDIKFYVDHYISSNTFAVYIGDNFEEFIFEFDKKLAVEKGLDFYVGHILKMVDEKYDERVKNNELKKLEAKPSGDPDMVLKNPGNVSYADLKAYIDKKNSERYKNTDM